ncbi:MAG: 30S ribosomal protein S9 [Candidatus Saganbacteria bacterium]|nr:30S ribosomal protein S9 [Candidatus Saganbacteria bacterium]
MAEHKKTAKKPAALPAGRQGPKAKAPAHHKKSKEELKGKEPKTKELIKAEELKAREHRAEERKTEEHKVHEHKEAHGHRAEAPKVFAAPRPRSKPAPPRGEKYYGTGRRKEATAKVWLTPGSGKMSLNGKTLKEYFCGRRRLEFVISRPLAATQSEGKFDVHAELLGGGIPAQADAVRLGIARALTALNPAFKTVLKREGLMTRDPRVKERKKYGLKRARRAFQYTKR